MADYGDQEIIRARRRSSTRSAGLIPRARDDTVQEVYVHRETSQDPYYAYDPAPYQQERGRSVSSTRSSRRRDFYDDGPSDRSRSQSRASSSLSLRSSRRSSLPDTEELSLSEQERKTKKLRNREILYASLATATTIAAANNIYQSTKAQRTRRQQLKDGTLTEREAKALKDKALMMDIFSVGVAAIGVNNAMNGWKKLEAEKKAAEAVREGWEEKRVERRGKRKEQGLLLAAEACDPEEARPVLKTPRW